MEIPEGDLDLLAIGETVVDLISVEETETLLDACTFRRYQGGEPANIAVYVAKLGGKAALISKLGAGAFGQFLRAELQRSNVLTEYLVMDAKVQTTVIFISRTPGTADSLAFRMADYQLKPEDVDERVIRRAKIVHASAFALSREPSRLAVEKALKLARKHGKIVSLDPNYNPDVWPDQQEAQTVLPRIFSYASITKPSLDDATRLFGPGKTPEAYIALYHAMGPEVVVLTMGEQGILVSDAGDKLYIPVREIEVLDATGAGDAFWAGFLVALLDGNPLKQCTLFAREIVERKLSTVGPFPDVIDRVEIYARVNEIGS